MRKMFINGVPYLWKPLSFKSPDGKTISEITVAYPELCPGEPMFLIDNNGENPFGAFSVAHWIPVQGIEFRNPGNDEKVTW